MHTSQPRGKLALRSSHRTLRLGISHSSAASSWQAPSKDARPAAPPPRPTRR